MPRNFCKCQADRVDTYHYSLQRQRQEIPTASWPIDTTYYNMSSGFNWEIQPQCSASINYGAQKLEDAFKHQLQHALTPMCTCAHLYTYACTPHTSQNRKQIKKKIKEHLSRITITTSVRVLGVRFWIILKHLDWEDDCVDDEPAARPDYLSPIGT